MNKLIEEAEKLHKQIDKAQVHLINARLRSDEEGEYTVKASWICATESVLLYMKTCYGMPADEWCKSVYEYTCEQHEKMQKDLEEYVNSSKNTAAGED